MDVSRARLDDQAYEDAIRYCANSILPMHFGEKLINKIFGRNLQSHAAGLLAVSEAMRRDMAAIGIDPAKVAVHYTGIDTARFVPEGLEPWMGRHHGLTEGVGFIALALGFFVRQGLDLRHAIDPAQPILRLGGNLTKLYDGRRVSCTISAQN